MVTLISLCLIILTTLIVQSQQEHHIADTDTYHLDDIQMDADPAPAPEPVDYDDDDDTGDGAHLRSHGANKKHEKIKISCYICNDEVCKEFAEAAKRKRDKKYAKHCIGEDIDRCIIIRNKKKDVMERRCLISFVERHMYSEIGCKKYHKTLEICTCFGDLCNTGALPKSGRWTALILVVWTLYLIL